MFRAHPEETMIRALAAAVALAGLAGCNKPPAANPEFEQRWSQLETSGAEPLFVESELHGAGLMGELRRAVDPVRTGERHAGSVLPGPLPDGEVVKVIRENLGGVKGCYALAEREGLTSSGKAIVNLEISANGEVSGVTVDAPAFGSSHLPSCVSGRARAWTFPKFTQGPKHFSYPFVFVGG
jgi:hypothetical protein